MSERVYCEECKWYKYVFGNTNAPLYQCHHPDAKSEVWSFVSPIKRPYIITSCEFKNCLVKNEFNDCKDFEFKDQEAA